MAMRRHIVLIPGPVLIGFAGLFDRSYGNPKTPRDRNGNYLKITPTRIGSTLLPFPCPYCAEVRDVVVDRKKWRDYHDRKRDFSWCPSCGGRFVLNTDGQPLGAPLAIGAMFAPALVEHSKGKSMIGLSRRDGLDLLGAE